MQIKRHIDSCRFLHFLIQEIRSYEKPKGLVRARAPVGMQVMFVISPGTFATIRQQLSSHAHLGRGRDPRHQKALEVQRNFVLCWLQSVVLSLQVSHSSTKLQGGDPPGASLGHCHLRGAGHCAKQPVGRGRGSSDFLGGSQPRSQR